MRRFTITAAIFLISQLAVSQDQEPGFWKILTVTTLTSKLPDRYHISTHRFRS